MIKVLLNILLVVGLVYLIREMFSGDKPAATKKTSSPNKPKAPRDPDAELLVEDPQCGVFVPVSTSVRDAGGNHFCSEECKKAWESAHG